MFHDSTLRFKHFPSAADGHFRSPYVELPETSDQHVLLEVTNNPPGDFRVIVRVDCWLFLAVEEFRYSVGGHGNLTEWQKRRGYIQEATESALLRGAQAFEQFGLQQAAKHYIFLGGNHCVETLGYSQPRVEILPLNASHSNSTIT